MTRAPLSDAASAETELAGAESAEGSPARAEPSPALPSPRSTPPPDPFGDPPQRPLLAAVVSIVVMLAGGTLGLAVTEATLVHRIDLGAGHLGLWTFWPDAGTLRIDPYALAIMARDGEIPLAAGEGFVFAADRDEAGRKLDRSCTYRLTATGDFARRWTLTLMTPNGRLVDNRAHRWGFGESGVLRGLDGTVTIEIAPRARPGNWLPSTGTGAFIVLLRLYDTAPPPGRAMLRQIALPMLRRLDCGPT